VLAARLSEDPDIRVALLEAGEPDDAPGISMPVAFPQFLRLLNLIGSSAKFRALINDIEKGAFRGAVAQHTGRFQAADRGTLLLDEIGDLPLELRPKLLRALQDKEIERLGGGHGVRVDVRIIAATNRGLWRMVEEEKFRADLYYACMFFR
jgi:transcriptional regulator with GAF, ATPase, and Fis domain